MGALRPGQMLEGTSYQVVREIGAGGMGVVYEIEHVRLKKRYVAKVIHEQISGDEGAARRMEREAQVLASISHPHIVQVHDVGTTPAGVSYFVMERLEGVDLRHMMKRQVIPRLRVVEIITDVLEALDYVHRRGIVHRDIKPENIFLSEQAHGTVTKVLDFGIVHIFDGDGRVSHGRITKTGGFVGTLYYAAPEQMQGKPAGPPNDVYAAGLVLFELLAGRGPFDDDPGVGLSRCFKPAPLLTELVPRAPRELSDVVAKALQQEPASRPHAGALAAELRAVGNALKSAPGAIEEDALRAEVDDLLRHMAPIDVSARPGAGRVPTPPDVMPEGTAVPRTPVMADAPRRMTPAEAQVGLAETLASATGTTPEDAGAALGQRPNAGGPPEHITHPPTMPGAELAPRHLSSPSSPPIAPSVATGPVAVQAGALGAPQRISSPGAPAPALSAPPPSPRFPTGTEHGVGPQPTPGGHAPAFATTLPLATARFEDSSSGAPARQLDTSPGLYATVDNQGSPPVPPKRTPLLALAALGGVLVLAVLAAGGWWFALRHKTAAPLSATVSSATAGATGTATVSAAPPTSEERANAAVTTTSATATTPPATSATTSSVATTTARVNAAAAPSPPRTTVSPAPKPSPPAARTAGPVKGVEKDGYVKDL